MRLMLSDMSIVKLMIGSGLFGGALDRMGETHGADVEVHIGALGGGHGVGRLFDNRQDIDLKPRELAVAAVLGTELDLAEDDTCAYGGTFLLHVKCSAQGGDSLAGAEEEMTVGRSDERADLFPSANDLKKMFFYLLLLFHISKYTIFISG